MLCKSEDNYFVAGRLIAIVFTVIHLIAVKAIVAIDIIEIVVGRLATPIISIFTSRIGKTLKAPCKS